MLRICAENYTKIKTVQKSVHNFIIKKKKIFSIVMVLINNIFLPKSMPLKNKFNISYQSMITPISGIQIFRNHKYFELKHTLRLHCAQTLLILTDVRTKVCFYFALYYSIACFHMWKFDFLSEYIRFIQPYTIQAHTHWQKVLHAFTSHSWLYSSLTPANMLQVNVMPLYLVRTTMNTKPFFSLQFAQLYHTHNLSVYYCAECTWKWIFIWTSHIYTVYFRYYLAENISKIEKINIYML